MPAFTCPACHAAIEPDLIESTGRAECPFCAADLSSLGLPIPTPTVLDETSDFVPAFATTGAVRALPPLPDKSLIRVAETTDERMVFYIPGGGTSAAGIGCFALFWNGFMVVFSPIMIGSVIQGGQPDAPPLWGLLAFLSLFWAVGLGMGYFWVRL